MACDVAIIAWPAHAIRDFDAYHPIAAEGIKLAFCNGPWAVHEGADVQGICYARLRKIGDRVLKHRRFWRVPRKHPNDRIDVPTLLIRAGLGVVVSNFNHVEYIWERALYTIPLSLACYDENLPPREAAQREIYGYYYSAMRDAMVVALGEPATVAREAHVAELVGKTPNNWRPISNEHELIYFRDMLGCPL